MTDTETQFGPHRHLMKRIADVKAAGNPWDALDLLEQLASEIKPLRERVSGLLSDKKALTEEKERLQGYVSDWRLECVEKDEEIERLRAALETCRQMIECVCVQLESWQISPVVNWRHGIEKAEAALSPQPEAQDNG